MKVVGSKCLILFREFQYSITKMHKKAPCFNGEWVVGSYPSKGEHKIYIWDTKMKKHLFKEKKKTNNLLGFIVFGLCSYISLSLSKSKIIIVFSFVYCIQLFLFFYVFFPLISINWNNP